MAHRDHEGDVRSRTWSLRLAGTGALWRRVLRRVPAVRPAGARPRPDGAGRARRSSASASRSGRPGSPRTALRARVARSRCSTAPTRAASRSSSAHRRTRCRPGWCASTRRSRRSAGPARASRTATARTATTRTPRSAGTPTAIARKVVGALRRPPGRDRLPGRQRARHGALPQPRGVPGLRRHAAGAATRTSRRSTASGGSSTGRTGSRAGTSCGRRTATRSPPTTSPGGATSRRSRRTSSPRRPTSCASSPARTSSSPRAWRCSRPAFDPRDLNRASLDVAAVNPYYPMQDALTMPEAPPTPRAARLDPPLRRVGDPLPGRPHLRRAQAAVPRDRDQRALDRRLAPELPRLRRPVAPGGVGARGPRRADGRVLALALDPLRPRAVLARRAQPRRRARPLLRRGHSGSRAISTRAGDAVVDLEPRRRRRAAVQPREQVGDGVPSAAGDRGRGAPTAAPTSASSRRFYEGLFGAGRAGRDPLRAGLRRRPSIRC